MTYQLSYWEKESFFKNIDVVIIGSGIVGLNAAIRLKELDPLLQILIIERGSLPIGASTRNAGFACFGSMTELLDDLENHSEEEVWALVEKRWSGLQKLRERCGDSNLRYLEYGGYELFKPEEHAIFEQCRERILHFNQCIESITGIPNVYQVKDAQISTLGLKNIQHLIHNTAEGQIHTGQMMLTLLKKATELGIKILNGITIKDLENHNQNVTLTTDLGWTITASKVIVATNGFAKNLLPKLTVQPARNQVLITQPIPNLKIKGCFHYEQGYYYFRNIDGRILLGGARNLAKPEEETTEFGTTELIQSALVNLLETVIIPNQAYQIDSWWSGIMGVGEQKKPIIQKISERVIVAVRLGGMGIAIGSLIGEEAAEITYS
jgi:glycine/D-amino acid oxidase-like deaminating enzyme